MNDNLLKSHAFKFKGRIYTLTVMQVLSQDKALFSHHLDEVIKNSSSFI